MSREDRLELVRMLVALHGMVAVVVAAGGTLVPAGGVLVVAGCLVVGLAVTASVSGHDVVVHSSALAAAVVSAATVVPLTIVVGVTGWVVVATLPLALVSALGLRLRSPYGVLGQVPARVGRTASAL